jgi:hypoxanthine phosphoribosyltransferase
MLLPSKEQTKRIVSFEEFNNVLTQLSDKIPKSETVWGVPLNGVIVAALLCKKREDLFLDLSQTPSWGSIIIDDICDSGKTLMPYLKQYRTATLYLRSDSSIKPFYYGIEESSNSWLVFPFELSEE